MNPTSQSLHYRLASLCLIGILSLGLSGCVGAVAGVGAAAVAAGTTEKGLGTSFNDGIIKTKISGSGYHPRRLPRIMSIKCLRIIPISRP